MRARVGVMRRIMRRAVVAGVLLAGAWSASGPAAFAEQPKPAAAASPIYGVTIPPGYRKWEMVAPAEAAPLDELRVVLGNPVAIRALEQATLPFPDGTILVKLAYKRKQSDEPECHGAGPGDDRAGDGEGLAPLCIDGRLGLRALHQRRAGRYRPASDVLCVPPGACEEPRLRVHAACAVTCVV